MSSRQLWNSDNQADWDYAEGPLYDRRVKPQNRELERRLEMGALRERLASATTQQFYEFLRSEYFPWKFTDQYLVQQQRSLDNHLHSDQMGRLEGVRRRLVGRNGLASKAMIEFLLGKNGGVHGLGVAGATGLLALIYPEEFGCVDRMVVNAFHAAGLFPNINGTAIKVGDAAEMISAMRDKAKYLNLLFGNINKWTPRTIDRALWAQRGEIVISPRTTKGVPMHESMSLRAQLFNSKPTREPEPLSRHLRGD